jgi:hypothetical protein
MTKRSNTGSTVDDEGEVRHSVLAYLHAHPQAADTLHGIVNWWLPRQRYDDSCQRVEEVLDGLVKEGLLDRDRLPGGEVLYALKNPTLKNPTPKNPTNPPSP